MSALNSDEEKKAGTRVDVRTASAVAEPTPQQYQRHIALYGEDEVGRCKALYARIAEVRQNTRT